MYACILCAVFVLAEAAWPRNAALSFGKGFAVMLQGAWLIRIADIMWTGALHVVRCLVHRRFHPVGRDAPLLRPCGLLCQL